MLAFVLQYCALRTSSSTFWARMGNSSLVRLFSTYNIMSSADAGHSSTAGHLLHELHDVALGRLAADLQVALVVVQHGHACSREWGNSTKAHLNHRFAAVVASQTSRAPSPPYIARTPSEQCFHGTVCGDVPEKSADPTPTMMMEIGCLDASTMAACEHTITFTNAGLVSRNNEKRCFVNFYNSDTIPLTGATPANRPI
jgi:hypothetical protein